MLDMQLGFWRHRTHAPCGDGKYIFASTPIPRLSLAERTESVEYCRCRIRDRLHRHCGRLETKPLGGCGTPDVSKMAAVARCDCTTCRRVRVHCVAVCPILRYGHPCRSTSVTNKLIAVRSQNPERPMRFAPDAGAVRRTVAVTRRKIQTHLSLAPNDSHRYLAHGNGSSSGFSSMNPACNRQRTNLRRVITIARVSDRKLQIEPQRPVSLRLTAANFVHGHDDASRLPRAIAPRAAARHGQRFEWTAFHCAGQRSVGGR